jgi:hypothetical protein
MSERPARSCSSPNELRLLYTPGIHSKLAKGEDQAAEKSKEARDDHVDVSEKIKKKFRAPNNCPRAFPASFSLKSLGMLHAARSDVPLCPAEGICRFFPYLEYLKVRFFLFKRINHFSAQRRTSRLWEAIFGKKERM